MTVSGIPTSSFFDPHISSVGNRRLDLRHAFHQLGQDVQAGNLSGAQSDLAAIKDLQPQTTSTQDTESSDPIAQALSQLGGDLQGETTPAKRVLNAVPHHVTSPPVHRFHHPTIGGSTISQLLSQLGQTVHPGSLSDVQRAYSAFQEETLGGANSLFAPVEGQSGVSLTA